MKRIAWCLLLLPLLGSAQTQSCQIELNGYLLGQFTSALEPLGEPFQKGQQSGWNYQAYKLPNNSYMVFEIDPKQPEQIAAIQITGQAPEMRPMAGIRLGDTQEQLIAKLGRPDKNTQEPEAEFRLFEYKDRNYTIEVNKEKRIHSIRIVGYQGCASDPTKPLSPDGKPLFEELQNAVLHRDVDRLMQVLAPDIELYHGDRTVYFSQAARAELESGDTEFTRLLFAPQSSVRALLQDEKAAGDEQMRFYENGSPGHVIKFPDSKIVQEIVYKFEAGRWKIWEIRFR